MGALVLKSCFLEAHYYSGGIRHHAFCRDGRPSWAPDADSVGFRDEVELRNGDGAVEVRRFAVGADHITWVGIYYRSVDAKLGDRSNHAGVGAWFLNAVPFDFHFLLHGIALLAQQMSTAMDPAKLSAHAEKFQSADYLPSYALPESQLAPSHGFTFGPSGLVETTLLSMACDDVGSSRQLADYLTHLMLLEKKRVPPRVLIHAAKTVQAGVDQVPDIDVTANIVRLIPSRMEALQRKADEDSRALEQAMSRSAALETENASLRTDADELSAFRNDPLHKVSRRLDDIFEQLRRLEGRPTSYAPAPISRLNPAPNPSPVSPSVRRKEPTTENHGDELIGYILWGVILVLVIIFVSVLIWKGVPMLVDAVRN